METYKVEEFSIGSNLQTDKIIFKSLEDMERAYKEIDNGKDIYLEKDDIVTKILNQMVNGKIYEGKITFGAKKGGTKC